MTRRTPPRRLSRFRTISPGCGAGPPGSVSACRRSTFRAGSSPRWRVRGAPRCARPGGSGFGMEVKRRITLGTYVLSAGYYDAYYLKAQKVRTLIRADFETAFNDVDLVVTPTSPTPAFRIGEKK